MSNEAIQDVLARTARTFSNRTAIEWRGKRVSYAELERSTNAFASHLAANEIAKGSVVALFVGDRIRLIEAMIGTLKAGCAFAPLDAGDPPKRLEAMITEMGARVFVVEAAFAERFASLVSGIGKPVKAIIVNREDGFDYSTDCIEDIGSPSMEGDADKPAVAHDPDDLCYIFFTSGSTGTPKAIAGRLKSLLHFVRWEIKKFGVDHTWKISQLAAPTFDACLRDVFMPLCAGATISIPPGRETVLDAPRLIEWIDQNDIDLIHCVPSVFRAITRENPNPAAFERLKYIIMAGERLVPEDIRRWMEIFDDRIQLVNLYGATENTMAKFCYFIKPSDCDRRMIPVGQPIEGARAILLDATGKPCDSGAVGEIYIRTPFLTLGYHRRPELTSQIFVRNPFSNDPNDVLHKTGDLGRVLPDGNFELIGRKDDQVKIRGFRVELGEIEATLKKHPGIAEAVALVKGEAVDEERLIAYFVARPDAAPTASDLRRFAAETLPDHMVPSLFVRVEAMPLTRTGKVDRNALPDPDQQRPELEEEFVAPRNSVEEGLAAIWMAILRLERAGIHDNFFQLGGHSLMATQVMSRVRQNFQVEIPLRSIFEAPTIAGLAAVIQRSIAESRDLEEARLIELVEQLSEDETEAMIARLSASAGEKLAALAENA